MGRQWALAETEVGKRLLTDYRIDELARLAGTTSRNIREYQQKGLLDYPKLVGRTGWYTENQLARARLIVHLAERGHSLSGIRQLLDTWESGGSIDDLIPAEVAFTKPWSNEVPGETNMDELREAFGEWITPENVKRAEELGVIEREGAGYRVPSPKLIEAGRKLVEIGFPLPVVLDIAEGTRRDAATIAKRIVDASREQLIPEGVLPPADKLPELTEKVEALRPLALAVTEGFFVQALQEAVTEAWEIVLGRTSAAQE